MPPPNGSQCIIRSMLRPASMWCPDINDSLSLANNAIGLKKFGML